MTQQSATAEWVSRWASSSAGATCRPFYTPLAYILEQYLLRQAYLDLDQLLDSVYNEEMVVPIGTFPDNSFISSPHPAILEGLFVRLIVVQISKNNTR